MSVRDHRTTSVEPLEPRRLLASTMLLDPTFGSDGRTTFGFADGRVIGTQPGGRVIVQEFTYGSGASRLLRVNADGTPDPTFDVGMTNFPVPDPLFKNGTVPRVDFQFEVNPTDGRIAYVFNGEFFRVGMLKADGTVDTSFDGDGIKEFPSSATPGPDRTPVRDLHWQGEDLLVTGERSLGGTDAAVRDDHVFVIRLKPDGSNDAAFGTSGEAIAADALSFPTPRLATDADGRIYVATHALNALNIVRLTAGGALDGSYGTNGVAEATFAVGYNAVTAFDVADDGTAYHLSTLDSSTNPPELRGVELSPNGDVRRWQRDFSVETVGVPTHLFPQADGKVLLVGKSRSPLDGWAITRLEGNGFVDTTYGQNGTAVVDLFHDAGSHPIGLPDGRVIVGGKRFGAGGTFQLARVSTEGGKPITARLNARGSLIVNASDAADAVSMHVRTRDGRLIVRVGDGTDDHANDFVASFAPSRVKRIAVFAGPGDDAVTIGNGVRGTYVDAGDGDDTVTGGTGGDALLGGGGKDKLFGFDGNDTLLGGASDDYLLGGAGKDDLFGEAGSDTLNGAGGNDRLFGGTAADFCNGGNGDDAALESDEDAFDSIETLFSLS